MTGRAVWGNEKTKVKKGRDDGGTSHNGKPSRNVGAKEVRNSKKSYLWPLPRAGGAYMAGGGVEDLDAAGEAPLPWSLPMILPLCLPLRPILNPRYFFLTRCKQILFTQSLRFHQTCNERSTGSSLRSWHFWKFSCEPQRWKAKLKELVGKVLRTIPNDFGLQLTQKIESRAPPSFSHAWLNLGMRHFSFVVVFVFLVFVVLFWFCFGVHLSHFQLLHTKAVESFKSQWKGTGLPLGLMSWSSKSLYVSLTWTAGILEICCSLRAKKKSKKIESMVSQTFQSFWAHKTIKFQDGFQ